MINSIQSSGAGKDRKWLSNGKEASWGETGETGEQELGLAGTERAILR